MQHYTYKPRNVCSSLIEFDLDENIVTNVLFKGGCNGNLKAVGILVDGMTVEEIEKKLKGNQCGPVRGTSCADQLAIAVKEAYESNKKVTGENYGV